MLLHVFCSETRADYKQYVPKLIIGLIQMFGDPEHSVVTSAWDALNAVTGVKSLFVYLLSIIK